MAYTFAKAANALQVQERTWAVSKVIHFTLFDSCIGVVARTQQTRQVIGVHLVMAVGEDWFAAEEARKVASILADNDAALSSVRIIGHSAIWQRDARVKAGYEKLVEILRPVEVNATGNGLWGVGIEEGQMKWCGYDPDNQAWGWFDTTEAHGAQAQEPPSPASPLDAATDCAQAMSYPTGARTPDEVRGQVRAPVPPSKEGIATRLTECFSQLKTLGLSRVVNQEGLIETYAATVGNGPEALEAARHEIVANNTTALTLPDDRYVALPDATAFDELHEYIHICSARGGVSVLKEWMFKMNEGAINVFSELTATRAAVAITARYPEETGIVKGLLRRIAQHGYEDEGYMQLYDMTFCARESNGIQNHPFFALVGAAYVATVPPQHRPRSEREWSADEARREFARMVQQWNVKWLRQRASPE